MDPKKKAAPGTNRAESDTAHDNGSLAPPMVTGQCGQVFRLVDQNPGIFSLTLTADFAIPETAARIHDLRAAGWNIITTIHPVVVFRGIERRNVASYSVGTPAWPRPGFFDDRPTAGQIELDLDQGAAQ